METTPKSAHARQEPFQGSASMGLAMAMPLFMVKQQHFHSYLARRRDVELRAVRPQWKNCKPGDTAVLQCGRKLLRKRVRRVHKGSLAKIFLTVDYHRIFPEVRDVMDAIHTVKELYPYAERFMAFELEDAPASQRVHG